MCSFVCNSVDFVCVGAVFPGAVQLQNWVQAVADRHSTTEQPGGALPSSELPHA